MSARSGGFLGLFHSFCESGFGENLEGIQRGFGQNLNDFGMKYTCLGTRLRQKGELG